MASTSLLYPKIPGSADAPLARCIAFEKYDGTNLHWAWHEELGWHAFGTRRDRFDLDDQGVAAFAVTHPELSECVEVFRRSLESAVTAELRHRAFYGSKELVLFTEFLGPSSFAGKHVVAEPKQLVILDLQTESGFLPPERFVNDLKSLPIARVVYQGRLTGKFAQDLREGKFDVAEGVVCKGERHGQIWMAKIKTNAYLRRLKTAFANDWESYWE